MQNLEKVNRGRIDFSLRSSPQTDILVECPHCGVKQYVYAIFILSEKETIRTCSNASCESYMAIRFSLYQKVDISGLVRKA